jgi:hypothetical protein
VTLTVFRFVKKFRIFYVTQTIIILFNRALKIKLFPRNYKLKLHWTLIRPVVTYASETWVLKENGIQKLIIFERKIFGPTKELNG